MASSLRWAVQPVDHDPFEGQEVKDQQVLDLLTEADKLKAAEPLPIGKNADGSPLYSISDEPEKEEPKPKDSGEEKGSILPISRNKDGWRFDASAGILGSLGRSLALPGDVVTGKVDPSGDEGAARAAEFVGNFGLGGSVLPKPEGSFGIFGGRGAQKAPAYNLGRATVEASRGASPEDIWSKLGWMKDTDGHWKFEIQDKGADFVPDLDRNIPAGHSYRLGDVFDHPQLFNSYPSLANLRLGFDPAHPDYLGHFDANNGVIQLNPSKSPEMQRSVLLHELQHAVQTHEGFSFGGVPEPVHPEVHEAMGEVFPRFQELSDKWDRYNATVKAFPERNPEDFAGLKPTPHEQEIYRRLYDEVFKPIFDFHDRAYKNYRQLAGEVEARNVQTRADMTAAQLRETHPDATADVTREDRRTGGGSSAASSAPPVPLAPHPEWHPDAVSHLLAEQRWFRNAEGPESQNAQFLHKIIEDGPGGQHEPGAAGHVADALRVHHTAAGPESLPPDLRRLLRQLHSEKELSPDGSRWMAPRPDNIRVSPRQLDLLDHAGYKSDEDSFHWPLTHPEPPGAQRASDFLSSPHQRANVQAQKPGMQTTPESRLQSVLEQMPGEPGVAHGLVTHMLAKADMHLDDFHSALGGGMHNPSDTLTMPTGEPGQMEFTLGLRNDKGEPVGMVNRVLDDTTAHHEMFEVNPSEQGTGIARKVLASQVGLYQKMGLDNVDMFANIDVGGYAWAKYGFAPTRTTWDHLVKSKLEGRLNRVKYQLDEEGEAEVRKLLKSSDPRSIWKVSDLTTPVVPNARKGTSVPLGKYLLLNSSWHGKLGLKDQAAMERFNGYVGKGTGERAILPGQGGTEK